jgi:hypothetical protein
MCRHDGRIGHHTPMRGIPACPSADAELTSQPPLVPGSPRCRCAALSTGRRLDRSRLCSSYIYNPHRRKKIPQTRTTCSNIATDVKITVFIWTRLHEPTDPAADVKLGQWVSCLWGVKGCRSMPHVQPEFMETHAQAQGGRAHDPGLTPGRGGPFRASTMMSRGDARASRVAAVRK